MKLGCVVPARAVVAVKRGVDLARPIYILIAFIGRTRLRPWIGYVSGLLKLRQ